MRNRIGLDRRLLLLAVFALSVAGCCVLALPDTTARAEESSGSPSGAGSDDSNSAQATGDEEQGEQSKTAEDDGGLNLLSLFVDAGWFFMLPILLASCLLVTLAIERFIALRRSRIMPPELIAGLGQLGGSQGGFDPRHAYRLCQQHPSSASTVIRSMLLKVGRPHSEVEHAVSEASEREADRLYSNARWLSLLAAVAPLWGLLGTVWGMIMAFYDTSKLLPGQNKADALAEGIYTALVTTLCGLFIAIPAAVLAHYFEGRITALFHRIDELLFNLLPQVERYEGRVRFNRQMGDEDRDGRAAAEVPQQVVEAGAAPASPR